MHIPSIDGFIPLIVLWFHRLVIIELSFSCLRSGLAFGLPKFFFGADVRFQYHFPHFK